MRSRTRKSAKQYNVFFRAEQCQNCLYKNSVIRNQKSGGFFHYIAECVKQGESPAGYAMNEFINYAKIRNEVGNVGSNGFLAYKTYYTREV